jgi:hypothetical protein
MNVRLLSVLGVLAGTGPCDGPITRTEKSYRLVFLNEFDYERLNLKRYRPTKAVELLKNMAVLLVVRAVAVAAIMFGL